MSGMNTAEIIGWSLILILFVICAFIIRWSFSVHKKMFDKTIQNAVQKELDKRAATQQPQPRQPKPGSIEDYERWKAERLKQQEEPQ